MTRIQIRERIWGRIAGYAQAAREALRTKQYPEDYFAQSLDAHDLERRIHAWERRGTGNLSTWR